MQSAGRLAGWIRKQDALYGPKTRETAKNRCTAPVLGLSSGSISIPYNAAAGG